MKITTKQITTTAVLLAICIVSQFFKNTSVYITGPIINACLIIAALGAGMACGIILSVITPVTSFLITGSPIMSAIPAIIPCVMIGNIILVVAVSLIAKKIKGNAGLIAGMASRQHCKGIIYGSRDCTGSDSVPASGSNGSKDGSVPDNIFRDTAYHSSNRKCAGIYYLDSFKKGNCRAELVHFKGKNYGMIL